MKKLSTHPQSCSAMNSYSESSSRISKIALALIVLVMTMSVGKISAQLSGTITVPSSAYPTLQNVFDSLNLQGISASVTVNVTAGNPQYPLASTNGYQLGSATLNSSLSSSKTLTFNGNGNVINAYVGTRSQTNTQYVGTGSTDAHLVIKGADYVTINNFNFRDTSTNTTQTTAMECAVAMYNLSGSSGAMDGCQYVNVTNCTFNFNNFNTNSYCIWIAPFTSGSTTQLTWSTYADKHAHINVTNNTMFEGFSFAGARGSTQDARARDINFVNNTVLNAGGGSAAMYGALEYYYVDTVNMSSNTVTMDNTHTTTAYVLFPYYCGGDYKVRNNTLNYVKSSSATTFYGIYAYCYNYGTEATQSDFRISGNNFNYPISSSVTSTTGNSYYNIYHYNYVYNSSAGTLLRGTSYVDSNTIENDTIQGSGTLYHIQAFGGSTTGPFKFNMRGNRVNNVLRNGMGGTNYLYYTYGWGDTVEIANNLFNNFRYDESSTSTTAAPLIYGGFSYHTASGGKPVYIHDNTWSNIGRKLNTSGSTTFYGCYTYGQNIRWYNNKMHNLYVKSYGTGGGTLYGLFLGSTTNDLQVANNVLDSFEISNSGTANSSGAIYGIYHGSNGTGIQMYNNFIGELYSRNVNNTNAVNGIYIASNPTLSLVNNTVQIGKNGAISSSGSTFGGSGVYYTSTCGLTMRNNIINVQGTPSSSTFIALRRNTGTNGTKPANLIASHNIYYVNQNANNYLYGEGTGTSPVNAYYNLGSSGSNTTGTYDGAFNGACGLYKNFMQDEASTFTENVLSAAGSVSNTSVPSGTTYAESSALSLTNPPISPDLGGATRGTFPDRGALEFAATAVDGSGPTVTFNSLPDLYCTTTGASLTASIADPAGVNTTSGTKPRLYYRRSTNSDAYGANNSSVNGWKYVEASNSTSPFTFNIDYSLLNGGAVAVGDKFYYYVVAQDNASTPNVTMMRASLLPSGTCPTSVNIGATSGLSGTRVLDSFSITNAPSFTVLQTPASGACFKDTISHMVIVSAASAGFPNYTAMGTNGRPSSNSYWDIDSIQINGTVNASTCAGGGSTTAVNTLPASTTNIYSNYTSNGNFVDLTAGTTNTWKLVMNNSIGNSYPLAYSIYIDYNRNGTFELPAETVATSPSAITMTSASSSCGPYPAWTGTFFVPTNVSSGPTLMRVMGSYSTVITSPTLNYSYGETEDYMVNLLGVPNGANHTWTSNKTGSTILGTNNPLRHASASDTTVYRDSMNIAGCPISVFDTTITQPRVKMLGATNSTQCGGGIPSASVSDSNGYSSPIINWYASATSTTALQSATNTTYQSPITATTTFWVAVQNPSSGCWSDRRSITATVTPADTFNARGNGTIDSVRVCSGSPVSLTITNVSNIGQTGGVFTSFAWSCSNPNSGITSTLTNSTGTQTITPSAGGEYVLTATASNTNTPPCRNVKYLKLSVQANPFVAGAAFVTAIPNPVCIGSAVTHTLYLAAPNATFPNYSAIGTNGRPTQTQYWDIDSFQLNSYVNVTNCAGGGSTTAVNTLPASVTNVYSNFTNLGIIETLLGGKPANWKIVMNNSIGNSYPLAYAIYVDYNRNGSFQLPEEQAVFLATAVNMTSASTTCGPYPSWSGSFNVPANVVSGPTLMRVMGSYSQPLTSPTMSYSYGETEDYIVNLVGPADTTTTKLAWQSNQTGTTVLGTDRVLVHNLPAATTYYKVSMKNGVCADTARDTVTNGVAALSTTSISGSTTACSGETLLLTTATSGGCIPYTYSWSSTGGAFTAVGSSTNNDSVRFTPSGATGSKTVNLTVTGNNGATVTSSITISYNNPTPTVISDTICGTKTASLSATPSVSTDVINWYASPNTFVPEPNGSATNTFNTPVLNSQKIYWARQFSSLIDSCEPKLAYYSTIISTAYGDEVKANKRVIMLSTDVYAVAGGASASAPVNCQVDISLINVADGSEVASTGMTTISVTSSPGSTTISPSRVNLGWKVDPGTYRVMLKNYSSNLSGLEYRYQTGIQPSWTASGSFGVTNGWIGANYDYYNMYFWNFQIEEGCWGAAIPDTVKYIAPPALTLSRKVDSICSGSCTAPVTLTSAASNFNTYTWNPSANWSGNSTTGWANCEPTVGNYTMVLTGTQTSGLQCANQDTLRLKVKAIPAPITKYPASNPTNRCNSVIDSLNAFSEQQTTTKIGSGTGYVYGGGGGWYDYPSPFPNYWIQSWQQYLYTAAELTAAGIKPGVIDAAAFKVATLPDPNTNTANDYRMRIGHTSVTSLSSWLDSSSMTLVTPAAVMPSTTYTTVPTTPLDVPFTNTFTWNGTSNIVVDIRLTEDYGYENADPEFTNTSFTSVNFFYATSSNSNFYPLSQTRYTSTSRPNIYLTQTVRDTIKWSPLTSLFTNSAATTAYTGNWRESVFARPNDSVKYYATAIAKNGCAIKDSVIINVTDTVAITQQPANFSSYCIGDTIKLIASASSTSPMTRQWRKNGSPLNITTYPSANKDTLLIPITSLADSGIYSIQYNTGAPCGPKISNTAIVKVRTNVVITTQPTAKTICVGSAFTLTAGATGDSSRFWVQMGGSGTNTGTTNTFTKSSTTFADSGMYFLRYTAFAPCRAVSTDTVKVSILPPAQITGQPAASTTLCIGQNTTLTPTITGGVQGYQWLKNGAVMTGETNATLTVTANTTADAGTYRLVAYSPSGCSNDTSSVNAGVIIVNTPVAITTQPTAKTDVCEGATYTSAVSASNTSGYEWYKDGVSTGVTTNPFVKSNIQMTDAGVYTVKVKGLTSCPDVFSNGDTMSVIPLAKITTAPTATTVCENQTMTLNAAGSNTVGYQWLKNGVPNGISANPLVITNAQMSDSATYCVIAISAKGCKTDTSTCVLGSVLRKVVINTQPVSSDLACVGKSYCVTVNASNTTGYTWYKNGTAVSPAVNSNTICKNPFTISDTGSYYVEITGNTPCPMVTSTISKITATYAANITTEPAANTDVCIGNTLSLSVASVNTASYQWYKNGSAISGQTTNTLTITGTTAGTAGTYSVVAIGFNGCTNDTSANAVVTMSTPLTFTAGLPISQTLCEGNTINSSVSVTGSGPYNYAWTHNGNALSSTTNVNTIPSITSSNAGKYIVIVNGAASCAAVRDTVDITVNKAPTFTTQPNGTTPICLGSPFSMNAAASNTSGIDWYKSNGTGGTLVQSNSNTYGAAVSVLTDAGTYYVIARPLPACTQTISNNHTLVINSPVNVSVDPVGASLLEDPAGSHTMTVTTTGTGPFTYQWRKNGANINGANSSSYTIATYVEAAHKGDYDCIVRSAAPCNNADTSAIAKIVTTKCPVINTQPIPRVDICNNTAFSLDVTAVGVKTYQWYKDGQPIAGATYPNYSVSFAATSDAGLYQVEAIAYNTSICPQTFSDTTRVVVKSKPVITQQPMGSASCGATKHTMKVSADFADNYQWYKNGVAISPNGTKDTYAYNTVNSIGDNFYVVISNSLCGSETSNTVNLKSINPATKVKLATKSVFDLVERCTDNNGWTYYAPTAQSDEMLLAIKKNGNTAMAKPDIEITKGIREISPINVEQRGAILGSRLFNLDFASTITKPYEVKFYFSKAEEDAVMTRWRDIRSAAGSLFSTNRTDTATFITSTQQPFTSTLWASAAIPLNFNNTIAHTDREFGVENGVRYVVIKKLIATRGGGTMFMDYKLGSANSAVSNINANGFGFSVYPVPSTDGKVVVEVTSKRMKALNFIVTDMTGRVIAKFEEKHVSTNSEHQFDFSNLANGNYQIQVANDEESMIGKFTISK